MVVTDIFVKSSDNQYTYWQAMEKIMRYDCKYYSSYETIEYIGKKLKLPFEHKAYLAERHGNRAIPIKSWRR